MDNQKEIAQSDAVFTGIFGKYQQNFLLDSRLRGNDKFVGVIPVKTEIQRIRLQINTAK